MQPSATTSQEALQQLQGAQASAQDPNSILKAQQQGLGVNAAQDTVTGLRGAINNTTKLLGQVAPSVMGRTGNSLVTSAQANRIIQNEQAPISQTLTDQGGKYTQAEQDLNNLQQEAQQSASGIYTGQQDKLSYLSNLYNSLYGQEQDAAKMAEQQREFNAQQATARAAAGGGSFVLGGAGSTGAAAPPKGAAPTQPALAGGKTLNDAATALKSLLATGNGAIIRNTLTAIQKSAKNGNTYDQAKLQLINQRPEFQQYLANFNNATF